MIEVDRDGVRKLMVDAISGFSEDRYSAGWLQGIEDRIRKMANSEAPEWIVLAYLAEGWPRLNDDKIMRSDGSFNPLHKRMDWEPLSPFEETRAREFIVRRVTLGPEDDNKPKRENH